MKIQALDPFGAKEAQPQNMSSFAQPHEGFDSWRRMAGRDEFLASSHRVPAGTFDLNSARDGSLGGFPHVLHPKYQMSSQMSAEEEVVVTADPIVDIMAAFYHLPSGYHADLFNDFRDAAQSHDLRQLLDTISDWAATAELYSHSSLATDLQGAIAGREGVADWLHG